MSPIKSRRPSGGGTQTTIDAALIEEWALSYLGRYASTAENLRRVLRRRVRRRIGPEAEATTETDPLIDALVVRYRNTGLLDDAAYAASRARRGLARGRSLRRIAAGLAAKGVSTADAGLAIAALRDETVNPDLSAAAAFARRRHLGPYRREAGRGDGEHAAALGAFARAGFDRRTAEAILGCPDEAALSALLAGDSE